VKQETCREKGDLVNGRGPGDAARETGRSVNLGRTRWKLKGVKRRYVPPERNMEQGRKKGDAGYDKGRGEGGRGGKRDGKR